jgi:hypothetical protein
VRGREDNDANRRTIRHEPLDETDHENQREIQDTQEKPNPGTDERIARTGEDDEGSYRKMGERVAQPDGGMDRIRKAEEQTTGMDAESRNKGAKDRKGVDQREQSESVGCVKAVGQNRTVRERGNSDKVEVTGQDTLLPTMQDRMQLATVRCLSICWSFGVAGTEKAGASRWTCIDFCIGFGGGGALTTIGALCTGLSAGGGDHTKGFPLFSATFCGLARCSRVIFGVCFPGRGFRVGLSCSTIRYFFSEFTANGFGSLWHQPPPVTDSSKLHLHCFSVNRLLRYRLYFGHGVPSIYGASIHFCLTQICIVIVLSEGATFSRCIARSFLSSFFWALIWSNMIFFSLRRSLAISACGVIGFGGN